MPMGMALLGIWKKLSNGFVKLGGPQQSRNLQRFLTRNETTYGTVQVRVDVNAIDNRSNKALNLAEKMLKVLRCTDLLKLLVEKTKK